MNDNFIYKILPKVLRDFVQSFYARISTSTPTFPQPSPFPRVITLQWSRSAIIIFGLLLLVAWSQLRLWIRYVPIGDLWLVEISQATQNPPGVDPVMVFVPTSMPTPNFDGTFIPDEEIWVLYFPTWIPDGFSTTERAQYWSVRVDGIIALGNNDANEEIRLFRTYIAGSMHPYAPAGMYEEVQVNGLPAILIHGRFTLPSSKNPNAQREWDKTLGLQLHWILGKFVYTLETSGAYVSESDLIRMAESMEKMHSSVLEEYLKSIK